MNRRDFLKAGVLAAAVTPTLTFSAQALAANAVSAPSDYRKYVHAKDIRGLTVSSQEKMNREDILEKALQRIPTRERVEQIHQTVITHIIAEEQNDVEKTMSTMIENPVFEDVAAGLIIKGHKDIVNDYTTRFGSFPSMTRTITNFVADAKGAWVELIWEGEQKGSVKGIKPSWLGDRKFVLPVAAYFDINEQGLITRETAYYDQYLGLISLDILPDVMKNKALLLLINPGLVTRLDPNGYR